MSGCLGNNILSSSSSCSSEASSSSSSSSFFAASTTQSPSSSTIKNSIPTQLTINKLQKNHGNKINTHNQNQNNNSNNNFNLNGNLVDKKQVVVNRQSCKNFIYTTGRVASEDGRILSLIKRPTTRVNNERLDVDRQQQFQSLSTKDGNNHNNNNNNTNNINIRNLSTLMNNATRMIRNSSFNKQPAHQTSSSSSSSSSTSSSASISPPLPPPPPPPTRSAFNFHPTQSTRLTSSSSSSSSNVVYFETAQKPPFVQTTEKINNNNCSRAIIDDHLNPHQKQQQHHQSLSYSNRNYLDQNQAKQTPDDMKMNQFLFDLIDLNKTHVLLNKKLSTIADTTSDYFNENLNSNSNSYCCSTSSSNNSSIISNVNSNVIVTNSGDANINKHCGDEDELNYLQTCHGDCTSISSSSSSCSSVVAFDNLTYLSSLEDLNNTTTTTTTTTMTNRAGNNIRLVVNSNVVMYLNEFDESDDEEDEDENENDEDSENDDETLGVNNNRKETINSCSSTHQSMQHLQSQQTEILFKKTLKSIKRKDKLKKINPPMFNKPSTNIAGLKQAKSMPNLNLRIIDHDDLVSEKAAAAEGFANNNNNNNNNSRLDIIRTNSEYEKKLKKLFRNQSLSRSMRRAKTVYYRNRRAKSLEDLTNEQEKVNYLINESNLIDRKTKNCAPTTASTASVDSCASSNGLASDISSSYFHELSDWSPKFSNSESDSSDEDLFNNFDWEANLSTTNLSEFTSANEDADEYEDDDDEHNDDNKHALKPNTTTRKKNKKLGTNKSTNIENKPECKSFNQIFNPKLTQDVVEKMFNDILANFLKTYPELDKELKIAEPASYDFLKCLKSYFITDENFNNHVQFKCFVCTTSFDVDEEVVSLNCNHIFHKICIQMWFTKSMSCPQCLVQTTKSHSQQQDHHSLAISRAIPASARETLL